MPGSVTGLDFGLPTSWCFATQTLASEVFMLCQAKVDEDAPPAVVIEKEVCWLYVSVDDVEAVDGSKALEERAEVDLHIFGQHVAEELAKVLMPVERQDGDDLVFVAEGGDERTDGFAAS